MRFKKGILFLSLLLGLNHLFGQSQAYRMSMLSNFNNSNLPKVDQTDIWNDLTGYYDPIKHREYIVCGGTDSLYFFDITEPTKMKLVDVEFGVVRFAVNRDYETYKHYAYCVSQRGSGAGALQIFDLNYLPDSVHKVYESGTLGLGTHTIHIDSVSKRLYMCMNATSNGNTAMDILSLDNPENPTFLASLQVPLNTNGFPLFNRVHEMYSRNDTAYLSCEEAGLYIFDLRDLKSQKLIATITTYPDQGYNHSSWLDKTGKYLMFTDENMGLAAKIFDIHDIKNPLFVSKFNSNTQATPHNAYWYGDFAYVSSYHDGVVIYNVRNPTNPYIEAWYDTHFEIPEVYGGYKGCWGVYPFLPSKNIIASDLTSGIYVFKLDSGLTSVQEVTPARESFKIYPNPAAAAIHLKWKNGAVPAEPIPYAISDMQGRKCSSGNWSTSENSIGTADLIEGCYFLQLNFPSATVTLKFLIGSK